MLSQQIRKRYYKSLETSINSQMSLHSVIKLWWLSFSTINLFLIVYIKHFQLKHYHQINWFNTRTIVAKLLKCIIYIWDTTKILIVEFGERLSFERFWKMPIQYKPHFLILTLFLSPSPLSFSFPSFFLYPFLPGLCSRF